MVDKDLMGCPFCGGEVNAFGYGEKFSVVHCNNPDCLVKPEINGKIGMDTAKTAWNTRAPSPELTAANERISDLELEADVQKHNAEAYRDDLVKANERIAVLSTAWTNINKLCAEQRLKIDKLDAQYLTAIEVIAEKTKEVKELQARESVLREALESSKHAVKVISLGQSKLTGDAIITLALANSKAYLALTTTPAEALERSQAKDEVIKKLSKVLSDASRWFSVLAKDTRFVEGIDWDGVVVDCDEAIEAARKLVED